MVHTDHATQIDADTFRAIIRATHTHTELDAARALERLIPNPDTTGRADVRTLTGDATACCGHLTRPCAAHCAPDALIGVFHVPAPFICR